jgi:membrane protein implicated in regulation of membrane protease activity
MEQITTILWLALAICFAIAEAATMGLVSVWFAAGSLVAMVASMLHAPLALQIALFLVTAAATLVLTRKFAKQQFNKARERTNADRVVGTEAIVTETVDNDVPSGQVRAGGQIWTARSLQGTVIPVGAKVTVRTIQGVKAMVEEVNPELK